MLNNLARKLDLITLRLFVAVQEEGTLTRAAARETIAVSAASKRLVELEEAVGMPLFVRHARGMELTAAGETLFVHARRMLLSMEAIGQELAEHAQGMRGYVRMVANLSGIVEFLPEDLMLFTRLHEQVRIDLEERPSSSVVKGVADGWADLGICSGEADIGGLESHLYRHDRVVLVMGKAHPLARRKHLTFDETLAYDHVGLHADSSINQRTHLAARSAGKPLKMRIHVPGFDAVCRMAQAGMGLGVIPAGVFEAIGLPLGLAAVEIDDAWAKRELRIVARSVDALSPVSRALFDFLSEAEARAVGKTLPKPAQQESPRPRKQASR